MSRRIRFAVHAALVAAGLLSVRTALVHADPTTESSPTPTTAPAEPLRDNRPNRPDRGDRGDRGDRDSDRAPFIYGMRRPGGGGGGGPGGWGAVADPTADEWTEIQTFMRENSPYRLSVYERLQNEHREPLILEAARRRLAWQFKRLDELKSREQGLYDFAFKQFKIEDQILAGIDKMQQADPPGDLDAQIEKSIHEWFDSHLAEREARLKRLREFVDGEQANLERDKGQAADLMERQRDRFENEVKRMANPPPAPPAPTPAPSPAPDAPSATQPAE